MDPNWKINLKNDDNGNVVNYSHALRFETVLDWIFI